VKSNPDPNVPIITIDVYNTAPTNSDVLVTASTSIGTLNQTSHTFTANGSFDFIATGPAGDITTRTVTVTNIDKIAPVIAAHANLVVGQNTTDGAIVSYSLPATSDNIDPVGTSNCLPVSGSSFILGNTTVTCNAIDTAGNKAIAITFIITVQGTSISFASNGPTAGNIPVGANDAVIQKFSIGSNSNIEVDTLRMLINSSVNLASTAGGNSIPSITDCKIKNSDTGATVTNSYDLSSWTANVGNTQFAKVFTDRFDVNAGQTLNLSLTCDISSTPPAGLANKALTGILDERQSGDIINIDTNLIIDQSNFDPSTALVGNPQTIASSGLTVAVASSPTSATVTRGTTVNALGINFTAGSASDIKVSQLRLQGFINLTAGATAFSTTSTSAGPSPVAHKVQDVVQSVTIWDGTTQVGVAVSPDVNGAMNFTNLAWNIPAGSTKTLTVQAILSNNLPYGTSPNQFFIDMLGTVGTAGVSPNLTAQDNNSNSVSVISAAWASDNGNRVNLQAVDAGSATVPVANFNTIIITSVRSGTMQVQVDGDTPVSALVSANTSDNAMTRLSFTTNNEAFNITRLTIANIGSASSSRSVSSVRVFDGNGTLFCSGAFDSNNHLRCANDAGLFTVNGNSTITIKANIAQVGSGSSATSGDAPKLALFADPNSATYTDDIKAVGISSGTALLNADIAGSLTLTTTLVGGVCGAADDCIGGSTQVIRKVVPTFATVASSTNLFIGQNTLYSFSVTAGANANVAIHKFTLSSSATASVIANTLQLYENGSLVDQSKYRITTLAGLELTDAVNKIGQGDNGIVVTFASEDKIGLNSTKTYTIKASVTSAPTSSSISTYMPSDTNTTGTITTGNIATINALGSSQNNLIWSDYSATVHTIGTHVNTDADSTYTDSSTDWTNGYLAQTLPSVPQSLSN